MYTKKIYFSGGSFYELQEVFRQISGVEAVHAGYINAERKVSYSEVRDGSVSAIMGIEVIYDPKKMDISMLMDILFSVVNPYEKDGQGKAKGAMYQSAVYYVPGEDEPMVQFHMNFIQNRDRPISASLAQLTVNDPNRNPKFSRQCYAKARVLRNFQLAEEEQQAYLQKHPEAPTYIDFIRLRELGILGTGR